MTTGGERHHARDGSVLPGTAALATAGRVRDGGPERRRPGALRRGGLRIRGPGAAASARASTVAAPWIAAFGALAAAGIALWLRHAAPARRRADQDAPRREAGRERRGPCAGERRFREVVEACPVGLLRVDRSGRITLANPQAARLFGWEVDALVGRQVEALVPEGLRDAHAGHRSAFRLAPQRRRVGEGGDVHGLRRDGTRVPLEIGLSPIGPPDEGTVLASVVDLTERHAEQRQLQSMLREKTVLLDEVHHRVKNNLQVITSLLSLQARTAPPQARAALAECRNRVNAMALTHQLLHENADVARLHFGEYLVRLARLLSDAHRASAPRVSLRVDGADTPLYLALPRAIPCGLLVNELVTQAYRHAFASDGTGTIVVGLAIDGPLARLWVADDGVPLPGEAPPEPGAARHEPSEPSEPSEPPRRLAWQLVPLLVEQLDGTLFRVRGTGTRFEVSLPVEDGARR